MSNNPVPVILIVSEHSLVGTMTTKELRAQDIFNDGNTDYICLHDVQIYRHVERATCVTTVPNVVVVKENVELVVLPGSKHEAPTKRYNTFVQKETFHVFLTVPGYAVQGELHLPTSRYDSLYTLTHAIGKFFPITQARVSGAGGKVLVAPVVLANRSLVSCFYVGESVPTVRNVIEGSELPLRQEDPVVEDGLMRQTMDSKESLHAADTQATTAQTSSFTSG